MITNSLNIVSETGEPCVSDGSVYVVAHCLLNPHVRLIGLSPVLSFNPSGKSVIQLPCPEAVYMGLDRREITKDQLNTPFFRRFCRELFLPYADLIGMLYFQGRTIHFLGISKSPSCAAEITSVGGAGGKNVDFFNKVVSGTGIFYEEIQRVLKERGIFATFSDVSDTLNKSL